MKWKSIVILIIILVSVAPVYFFNRYLQKIISPRKSFGRLLFYFLSVLLFVFAYTFLVVMIINKLLPPA